MKMFRRDFLRRAGALSMLGPVASPLALNLAAIGNVAAQTAPDYKALVCVFFQGGNDAYNMVLATDPSSWSAYTAVRKQQPDPISLLAPGTAADASAANGSPAKLGGVLALNPVNAVSGRSLALHPSLVNMSALFNTQRRLAVMANVGPLLMPTSKSQYAQASYPKPQKLFSHNDQQSTWQALLPEGVTTGWGGRMVDALAGGNGAASTFTSVSASGNSVWLAGDSVLQYQVGINGAIQMGLDSGGKVYGSSGVGTAMTQIVSKARTASLLQVDHAAVAARSIAAQGTLASALPGNRAAPYGAPGTGTDPTLQYVNVSGALATNNLAQQFQIVARMMTAGRALGVKRQIFFVSLGSFDTHNTQNPSQADLMLKIDHGFSYFDGVLTALGLLPNVTTFTMSDFGRTFTSNGDGTDHGWGSHHFMMGGAVKGGNVYGSFPVYAPNDGKNNFASADQLDGTGAMLPSTSVEQYAGTLGSWFGVSDANLASVLPNLANWNTSQRNLGFMA